VEESLSRSGHRWAAERSDWPGPGARSPVKLNCRSIVSSRFLAPLSPRPAKENPIVFIWGMQDNYYS